MAAFDDLQRASFVGFEFPVSEIEVIGGLRDHVHEFPHSPGGAVEKLGRKLYEIRFKSPMLQGLKNYPLDLWPTRWANLRVYLEGGGYDDLVIPTIGTIKAYCTSWKETTDPKGIRNGVIVDMTFREAQQQLFLVEQLIQVSADNVAAAASNFSDVLAIERARNDVKNLGPDGVMVDEPLTPNEIALFDEMTIQAALVEQALNEVDSVVNTILTTTESLINLCALADATSRALNNPMRFRLLDAMRDLWRSAVRLNRDARQRTAPLIPYVTPNRLVAVSDVSRAVYGNTSRAAEIMQLNAIPNPFAIPANTTLLVYKPAA